MEFLKGFSQGLAVEFGIFNRQSFALGFYGAFVGCRKRLYQDMYMSVYVYVHVDGDVDVAVDVEHVYVYACSLERERDTEIDRWIDR